MKDKDKKNLGEVLHPEQTHAVFQNQRMLFWLLGDSSNFVCAAESNNVHLLKVHLQKRFLVSDHIPVRNIVLLTLLQLFESYNH